MLGLVKGVNHNRPKVLRESLRPARLERWSRAADEQVVISGVSPTPAERRRTARRSMFRPRLGTLGVGFAITAVWLLANVRRVSPIDILPFAWTWLTVWLALSVGLELWEKHCSTSPYRRRPR